MHLYVMARGIVDHLKRWENDLLAQYLPYKYDKDKPMGKVQLSVRPVQLYEIVFPEDQLQKVLGMVQPGGYQQYRGLHKLAKFISKLFGLKSIPKYTPNPDFVSSNLVTKAVGVHGIGIKKDVYGDNGIEQL